MKAVFKILFVLTGTLLFSFVLKDNSAFETTPYKVEIPQGFPDIKVPDDNQLTKERIDLGRMLFYDPILSVDSSISCASCHKQEFAFADTVPISPGVEGRLAGRNAPTLTNVAYNPTVLFDGFLQSLEMQILVPIQEHAEFDFNIVDIGKKLNQDSTYVKMSFAAYNRAPDPYVITRSISAFERTLISGNSKFDQEVYQKKKVMNRSEKRGMNLFYNELHCAECHSGFNFTNFSTQNNGLYEVYSDSGRQRVTELESDRALFKVPTLRNITLTAPYMHDGSIATLDEVIDHYEKGGKAHPNKNPKIQPFKLNKRERKDLINFLNCLTDTTFLTNKAFGNPF
ncbi:MAG: c-type cytochrome [Flavobacteriales bacterium]|nr:c-type cytochrome [Flavobacteriales bacterium]